MTNLTRQKPKKCNICYSISFHVNKPCICNTHLLLPSLIQAELIHDKDAPHSNEQKKNKDCQHGHHWWEPDISGSCLSLTYNPLRLDLCVFPCLPFNPKLFTLGLFHTEFEPPRRFQTAKGQAFSQDTRIDWGLIGIKIVFIVHILK